MGILKCGCTRVQFVVATICQRQRSGVVILGKAVKKGATQVEHLSSSDG